MSEEYIPPLRFTGRNCSRVRNTTAISSINDAADAGTVQVKLAISISKRKKINVTLTRDNSDGATELKKLKLQSEGKDPESFTTDDTKISYSAVKQDQIKQKHDPLQMTKLPASRIVVKGEGCEEYLKGEQEEAINSSAFCTFSSTASMDQFMRAGMQMPSGRTMFFSEARLQASTDSQKRGEDDTIFSGQFKRHPLKTYSVDNHDSTALKQSGSKRKGRPRGRKPLTVHDPELNEHYSRNCAAQLLKEKPDVFKKNLHQLHKVEGWLQCIHCCLWEYYVMHTVARNVKQTHTVQELGETQDFMDEVDDLLDSLQDTNPTPCLALSTSAMMFLLSRDSLNMDLDQDSLTLMVRLSGADTVERHYLDASALKELQKVKQKVMELLTDLPQETHASEIGLGFVSTGNLATESLLSLTLKRADEWFKEWSPWGLDPIVDFVTDCEHSLPGVISQDIQKTLPFLRKLNRCLKVLAEISSNNFDSQNYLISYKTAALVQACTRMLQWCQTYLSSNKMLENVEGNKAVKHFPGDAISTCMVAVLKVLDTVTFENEMVNLDLNIETSMMETIVRCLTTTHWHVPMEKRFEVDLLCLSLLRTLVKHKKSNCQIMMSLQTDVKYTEKSQPKTMSAIKAVVELFVQRDEAACQMEEDEDNQSILEDDQETFTEALGKASKLVDYDFVASYAGLLLGFTIVDNKDYATTVKKLMPNENFDPVIKRLKTFLSFIRSTALFSSTVFNTITKVIRILQTA